MNEKFPYEDIVNLPPHHSSKYPQPDMADRAARFAPFAAITGYEEMVMEEARVTEGRIELDEGSRGELDEKLNMILAAREEKPEVTFTCFVPDKKKAGGAYVEIKGTVKGIDYNKRLILLDGGEKIKTDDISKIESDFFGTFC